MIVEKLVISASLSAGLESKSKVVTDWELGTHVYTQYSYVNNWRTPFSLAIKHTRLRLKTVRAVITP